MLEVVFGDSEKGSMKLAKVYDKKNMKRGAASIGYIGEGPQKKPTREQLERMFEGEAIGGSSQDVVSVGCNLDIGDISGEFDGKERREEFARVFTSVKFTEKEVDDFFRQQRADYEKLIAAAKEGRAIRAWVSNAPYSACGFAFLCHAIAESDCPLSVVPLPACGEGFMGELKAFSSWGEVEARKHYSFLPLERAVSWEEKLFHAGVWLELQAENAPFRAFVNGRLISVPEDFYDHIILKHIPEGEFVMARLIGEILAKNPMGVGDFIYALRIQKMIAQNTLEIVGERDPDHPYGIILKKN
jgi:hypothetical protein